MIDFTTGQHQWLLTGFSPRKNNLTLYIMQGVEVFREQVNQLGKTKNTQSCLHIKKLGDIDFDLLGNLIEDVYNDMKKRYPN